MEFCSFFTQISTNPCGHNNNNSQLIEGEFRHVAGRGRDVGGRGRAVGGRNRVVGGRRGAVAGRRWRQVALLPNRPFVVLVVGDRIVLTLSLLHGVVGVPSIHVKSRVDRVARERFHLFTQSLHQSIAGNLKAPEALDFGFRKLGECVALSGGRLANVAVVRVPLVLEGGRGV